jgi:leucyl-tRNA synthetase
MTWKTTVNNLYKLKNQSFGKNELWKNALENIVICVAPFAPHFSEELWEQLGHSTTIHKDTWPRWDEDLIKEEMITLAIQINGKVRGEITVAADITNDEAITKAKSDAKIAEYLSGKEIKKAIYVPGRLVSLVV